MKYLMNNPKVTYYRLAEFDTKETVLDNLGTEQELSYLKNLGNENKKKMKYEGNQIGDFGEWFFMMKAVASELYPFLIKSIGVDILLFDSQKGDNGQAVSVKTFSKEEHDSYEFEFSNVDNLKDFSLKWDLEKEPLVALQQMIYRDNGGKKEYYKMYNFTIPLSYLENANQSYLHKSGAGYTLNWEYDNLLRIQNDENISFDMVIFDEPFIYEQIREKNSLVKNKILRFCKEKDVSINKLSIQSEISETIIHKIVENNYVPSLEEALRISSVLGLSVNDIFSILLEF